MQSLNKQQLHDIMIGAALLGAGGGGSPAAATRLIDAAVNASPAIPMVAVEEVDDSASVCVVAGMGSPIAALNRDISREIVRAFELLQEVVGKRIDYVVPVEIGGGNTIVPMVVASHSGAKVVDADGAGRSIPELEMTTFAIFGVPISPLTVADAAANAAVVYTESPSDAERIGRVIAVSYGNHAGIACHPMTGKTLKEVALAGTVSFAGRVGEVIRRAKESGSDAAEAVLQMTNGYLLARGTVAKVTAETREGFDFGSVEIAEEGKSERLRIGTKNENMIAWRGDKPVAIVPDLICFLGEAGDPLTNADMREGMRVSVIGLKSDPKWRQPKAWSVFEHALGQLGHSGPYVPIEELLERT